VEIDYTRRFWGGGALDSASTREAENDAFGPKEMGIVRDSLKPALQDRGRRVVVSSLVPAVEVVRKRTYQAKSPHSGCCQARPLHSFVSFHISACVVSGYFLLAEIAESEDVSPF
jgi:hypothetical protein